MDRHLIAYYIGILIIFASHVYMLYAPNQMTDMIQTHAYINILAGILIAYYFTNKEGIFKT